MTLSPETYALIEGRMKAGGYRSPDDVVRAALDILNVVEEDELDDGEIEALRTSITQMRNGDVVDWTAWSAKHRQ